MTPKFRERMELSGGRRFLLTIGAGIASTVLQWYGKLDAAGSTYAMIVLGTVAAYIGGNTYQKKNATTKEEAAE